MVVISGGYATHDQIEQLQKSLETFNDKSSRQTSAMLWLTGVIAVLTVVQAVATTAQVLIAFKVIGQ
jgi:hypothetical protein